MQKKITLFAAFSGAMAVALGALGAHYLKSKFESGTITPGNIQTFETAVRYQMYHTFGLFGLVFLMDKYPHRLLNRAAYCFVIGILFFSGSLYLLSTKTLLGIENYKWLGPITPLGGLSFILGWIFIFVSALKTKT